MYRTTFTSTREGLDQKLYPYRLWTKAKRLGTWDPASFDFAQDRADWNRLDDLERDLLLRLTAQFQGGEESVTYDLLPVLQVAAEEQRIEDEMFLTAYLWEEAKHVEGFGRFLAEVVRPQESLDAYFTDAYRLLFMDLLPTAMNRLRTDRSPSMQAEAAVTYQMIVEGVLAETGYQAYYRMLKQHGILPGMQGFIQHVQRDESRHVAYGVYWLARLVAEHGDAVWSVVEQRMNTLLPIALQHIQESLAPYGDSPPFGVTVDDFLEIGMGQFQKRYARIEQARHQALDDVRYGGYREGDSGEGSTDASSMSASLPPSV